MTGEKQEWDAKTLCIHSTTLLTVIHNACREGSGVIYREYTEY